LADTNGLPVRMDEYPTKKKSAESLCFSPHRWSEHCRRVATRYGKLGANYLAFVQLASTRLWLRVTESTS
jgi:hypothetical protein